MATIEKNVWDSKYLMIFTALFIPRLSAKFSVDDFFIALNVKGNLVYRRENQFINN
jgi:hypothetical protein